MHPDFAAVIENAVDQDLADAQALVEDDASLREKLSEAETRQLSRAL